jgi:hypothetical protein
VELPAVDQTTPPLIVPGTVVRFTAGQIDLTPGEQENVITAVDGLTVEYHSIEPGADLTQLTMTAQRGVIFTKPAPLADLARNQLDADAVLGVYLEGSVLISAQDGDYVARAPRVYYDFTTGRAILLEAVLRTYSRESRLPIYARAEEMRQIAANQWQARRVTVSTSEFHKPHLAIGAERMTVTRQPARADPEQRETYLESTGNVLKTGDLPLAAWPRFAGTVDDVPLRSVTIGTRSEDGVAVESRWDLLTLLGRQRSDAADVVLKADFFSKRGPAPALGLDIDYELGQGQGAADLYGMYDRGEDRTSAGRDVDPDDEWRGVALWEHQMPLSRDWLLQAQASWISDETFISARREDDFENRREYETSLYIKHQRRTAAFTALLQYELNDFISNDYLLASRQLQVDKFPESTYRRYGDPWFDGRVVYSGETRLSRMRFVFEEGTPEDLGVRGRAFGIPNDEPISDALREQGLSSQWVSRFDTRHELTLPGSIGSVNVVPFVVGRLTAYSDDFEDYSDQADSTRVFGAAGIRVGTQFQRVDDHASSRLLGINRLRHIIEPSMTVWYGYADVSQDDLPIYDPEVESLGTGAAIRLGVRNTWQTQRGGPGRWRSVDMLTVNADVVFNSGDADRESPAAQFFDYRPEYSQFGDHVAASFIWLLSDSFSLVGEQTIDIDESAIARGSIGAELQHAPDLSTYVEFRYLDASDNELLGVRWTYRLSPVYQVSFRPQWDFRQDEFRSVTLRVTRSFPDFDLEVQVKHDEIKDDTSIGASLDLVEF